MTLEAATKGLLVDAVIMCSNLQTSLPFIIAMISIAQAQSYTCSNSGSSYCGAGYSYVTAANGSHFCSDINECTATYGPCQQNCVNTCGSFTCSCGVGYTLASDGLSCNDINECSFVTPCWHICTNTPGSYYCSCNAGYAQNGYACYDINECSANGGLGPCQHMCTNTLGSFYCTCRSGYTQPNGGYYCNDIDECTTNSGRGPCDQICTNTPGSYQCSCAIGYILAANGQTCNDINECNLNGGLGYCQQRCTNTLGSFSCSCNVGYTQFGYYCTDIDECKLNGSTCQQICNNTIGSYTCSCSTGYTLAVDGHSCNDINECIAEKGLGPCQHNCINTVGSFRCQCMPGYVLQSDGYSCHDIDECSTNNRSCEQICVNEPGSYYCDCYDGYVPTDYLNGWCNSVANVCLPCPCQNEGTCHKCGRNDSYHLSAMCQCSSGYTGQFCEDMELRTIVPSIVIPTAVLAVLLIITAVLYKLWTRHRGGDKITLTKNSIYEMVKLKTYLPSANTDYDTSAMDMENVIGKNDGSLFLSQSFSNDVHVCVIDKCTDNSEDTTLTCQSGVISEQKAAELIDTAPPIPERKYGDDLALESNVLPPIPERNYEDDIMETNPPLPARKYPDGENDETDTNAVIGSLQ